MGAAGCSTASQAPANQTPTTPPGSIKPARDQRALDELKAMGQALGQAKSLEFEVSSMAPIRGPNGQWLHVLKTAKVEAQRPNRLFVETGGDAFPQKIFFDGKTLSISAPEHKLYTQTPLAGDIDAMMAQSAKKGGNVFVFADVLLADPYSSWVQDLEGAVLVGDSTRGHEKLRHLAFTAKDEDWEVWVDTKTHLPRMVYAKYLGAERSPAILVEFNHWKLNSSIPGSVFAFHAPKDSKKAELRAPTGGEGK
jgi:hypothetical protein